jgi:hypothetical protein
MAVPCWAVTNERSFVRSFPPLHTQGMTVGSRPIRKAFVLSTALAVVMMSCGREPTGSGGAVGARTSQGIAFTPVFPPGYAELVAGEKAAAAASAAGLTQANQTSSSGVAFVSVRIVLRNADGSIAKDTLVTFPPGATEMPLTLTVPLPGNAPGTGVPLSLNLAYTNANGQVVFSGSAVVTAVPTVPGQPPPPPSPVDVQLTYVGPGSSATRVVISPTTLSVPMAGAFTFTAQAFDASNTVVPNTPVVFSATNPAIATISAAGVGQAQRVRGSTTILATLLTGPSAGATLNVTPVAASIAAVSGSGQSAKGTQTLPNPLVVRVTALDGLPMAGATVTFAAAGGGTMTPASAVSGADGTAQSSWKLGPAVGPQSATASAATATGVGSAGFTATALPPDPVRLVFAAAPPGLIGAGAAFGLSVQAVDESGAVTPAFVGSIGLALTGGPGALSGPNAATAAAGVANFAGLSITAAGAYTLTASSGSLAPVAATITVQPGAAANIAFTGAPTTAVAGATLGNFAVTVRDASGNTASNFTGIVSLTATGPAGGAFIGTASAPAAAGIATIAGLKINVAGVYTVTATAAGVTGAATTPLTITAGPPTALSLVSGGGQSAVGGAALPAGIVVKVSDALGNGVPGNTVTFTPAAGNGTAAPPSIATGGGGLAATAWTIGAAPGTHTLSISAASVPTPLVVTATGTGTPGVATQLAFTQQPISTVAGVPLSPSVTVSAKDAFGAVASTFTGNITLALGANPGGSTLSGTLTVAAVAGVATFPGISLNKVGTGYTLGATSAPLTAAVSAAFNIAASLATTIVGDSGFAQTAPINTLLPQKLVARVIDSFGNPVPGENVVWNVAGGGGSLSATTNITDATGRVRTAHTLGPTLGANTVTATSGTLIGSPVNFISNATPIGGNWDLVADWSYTSPTFHDWTIGYRNGAGVFAATAPGDSVLAFAPLFGWNSTGATFKNRSAGVVNLLSAQWQPNQVSFHPGPGGNDGSVIRWTSPIAGPVIVMASFDGTSTAGGGTTANVHALKNGAPVWDAKLAGSIVLPVGPNNTRFFSGVTTVAIGDVIDFWSDPAGVYSADQIGVQITITGTAASAGAVSQLAFQTQPTNAAAGATISPPVQVVAKDGFGNTVTSFTGNVTLAFGANPGSSTLSGTTTVAAVAGVATFSNLSIAGAANGYTLVASSGSVIAEATSAAFNITSAGATQLAFTAQPTNAVAGASIAPSVVVTAKDALNNTDAGYTGNVTLAISANPGGSTLSGTLTVAAVAGVATFPGISLDKIGVGYTIGATSGALTPATSGAFNITAAAAFAIVADSGGGQAGLTSATLPNPFVARVIDQFGNKIVGHTVAWNVAGGGGSLGGVTTTTDANGRVRATLTLGATPGANTATATATGIGTPATFTAMGNSVVANVTWTGATSTDWHVASNWSPAAVPTATDSVVVNPGGNQPVLTANAVSARFTLNSGATLSLGSFSLDAGGSVNVPATGVSGTGKIRMNGASATVVGVFTNLEIFGGVTQANGAVTVTGTLSTVAGRYDVGSGVTTVGTFAATGSGGLRMQSPSGELVVNTAVSWGTSGGYNDTELTAGTLRVKGTWSFGGCIGSHTFNSAGTHTVSWEGTAAQTFNAGCYPGLAASQEHFRNVVIANTAAAVSLNGPMDVSGTFVVNAGASLAGTGTLRINAGGLTRIGAYTLTNTIFYGTGGSLTLPAQSFANLTFDGAHTYTPPAAGFATTGTLTVTNNALFDIGGATTTVNALTFNTGGHLRMQNAAGDLTATGAISWSTSGGYNDTELTAGIIRVKGSFNFGGCVGTHTFNASGAHTVSFEGTAAQTWNTGCYTGTGAAQEHFRNVIIANTGAAVTLNGTMDVTGNLTVNAGTHLAGTGNVRIVAANLTRVGAYTISTTTFLGTGGSNTLPALSFNNLTFDGAHTYAAPAAGFAVVATLTVSNNALFDIGAATTTINALTFTSGGHLRMQNAAGDLTTTTSISFGVSGGYNDTELTAGILRVKGSFNFAGCAGTHSFNAAGTHTVSFEGTAAQTWNTGCYTGTGAAQEHFRNVIIANTAAAVSLNGTMDVTGNLTVNAGATLAGTGNVRIVAANLTRVGAYTITNTTFLGTGGSNTLPALSYNNLTFDGAHTYALPASAFAVTGTLTVSNNALFDVGAGTSTVNNLTFTSGGHLRMQNAAGDLTTTTSVSFGVAGGYNDTELTAGILRVKGTFGFAGCAGTHSFNAAGTHTVSFEGTAAQTWNTGCYTGTGAAQEHFRNVIIANTAAAVSLNGTMDVTGNLTVNAGATLAGSGNVRIVAANLTRVGAYTISTTTFLGTGGSNTLPALSFNNLVLDGAHTYALPASAFAITGTLTVSNNALFDVAAGTSTVNNLTFTSGGHLRMQNAAGDLTTTSSVSFGVSGGYNDTELTAGILRVKGTFGFAGCAGTHSFNAAGTHTVSFEGTAAQTWNTGCYTGTGAAQEHFRNVIIANTAASVSLNGTMDVTGNLTVNAGATLAGTGNVRIVAANLTRVGAYTIANTTFLGTGGSNTLPALSFSNLTFDGAHTYALPASAFAITGTLTVTNNALFDVGAGTSVVNNLSFTAGGHLRMQNAAGDLTTTSSVSFGVAGGYNDTELIAGILRVKGTFGFAGCSGTHSFNAAGTHTVSFEGTAAQTWSTGCYTGTAASQEHFRNVIIANTAAAVSLNGTADITGTLTVNAGATLAGSGNARLQGNDLVSAGTISLSTVTYFGTGGTSTVPGIPLVNLTLDGTHNFGLPASGFVTTGTLTITNGAGLETFANPGNVASLSVTTGGRLRMRTAGGLLVVSGAATFSSPGVWGDSLLTNGTLRVGGAWNFGGCSGSANFNASGSHTVEVNGTAAQSINTGCYPGGGLAQEHFGNLSIINTSALVTFGSGHHVKGTFTQAAGTSVTGGSMNMHGTWSFAGGVSTGTTAWTFTRLSPSVNTLPAVTLASVALDSSGRFVAPTTGLSVTGSFTANNGAIFDVADAVMSIGSLTMNSSSRLRMTDAAGDLTVNGAVTLNATGVPYRDTSVVAGTLRVSGGIAATCGLEAFNARGTHIIEIFGSGNPSIGTCATADTTLTGFHLNELRVNKSAGTLSMTSIDAMGKLRVQSGTFSASGVAVWDSVQVTGGVLTGPSLTYRKTGQVIPSNTVTSNTIKADASIGGGVTSGAIVVDSVLLDHTGTATIAGNLFTGNGGRLRMATANTLTVNGNATFQGGSTAGLLQDGRLELKGNFSQGVVSTSFAADGVHRTAFIGTGLQAITMTNAGSALSRFNDLELANISAGSTQIQSTNVVAKGNLIVPATAGDTVRLTTSGVVNLTVGGVNVSGAGSTRFKISNARLTISSASSNGSVTLFDNVTFGTYGAGDDQLTLAWTPAGSFTFNGLKFTTVPNGTSGHYVVMNSGISTSLTLAGATPGGVTAPLTSLLGGFLIWP